MLKTLSLLTGIALAAGAMAAHAGSSVATVPTGMISCPLPKGSTSYLSLPLANTPTYTSSITAVTATTITVGDSPAPFTSNLATDAAPYLVKFLSGAETGRLLLITANTASTLTLDINDNSSETVTLTTAGFSVAVGDTFEIIPASTLASTFGTNTTKNPLVVTGSTSIFTADSIGVFNPSSGRWNAYYFNSTAGYWEAIGSSVNANNTILFPNGALTITRRDLNTDGAVTMHGKVTEVPALIKTTGNSSVVYSSTGYAADMTLAQLQFGSNWVKSDSALTASTISLWNSASNRFDTYYQDTNSVWHPARDSSTDVSSTVIAAGTAMSVLHRATLSGGASFLPTKMPYSL